MRNLDHTAAVQSAAAVAGGARRAGSLARSRRAGRTIPVALLASLIALLPATAASGAGLPDGRAYELVSPNAASDANVYVQTASPIEAPDVLTQAPFRAAQDGNGVVYAGEAEPTGGAGSTGEGLGDEFKATRSASDWSATDIMAPRQQTAQYEGFTGDLSVGALMMQARSKPPLTSDAPQSCNVMYLRTAADEAFHATFTDTQTPGYCGDPEYAGFSTDGSHVIFRSEAALTPQGETETAYNLYESVAGRAYLVSVLPSGEAAQDATFGVSAAFSGGVDIEASGEDLEHVISADGSRVVWTDLDTALTTENPSGATRLFVREDPESPAARTVQVDGAVGGGGQYRGASSDDSLIYFTKEEKLYQYDLQTATTTDLTPAGGVVGLAGISNDGQVLYPVAKTVLTTSANSHGETATPGNCTAARKSSLAEEEEAKEEAAGVLPPGRACDLYVLRIGHAPRFIATLLPADDRSRQGPSSQESYGDWVGNLALRSSEVSAADGQVLAFMSKRSLTGYDNNALRETFVYDASDEQLACATCNPSGDPAVRGQVYESGLATGENYEPIPYPGSFLGALGTDYQYRWVSADGDRVFFDTTEALLPQDTNGLQDVYEWERAGEGSCRLAAGCLYLISGYTSTEAYFADASESGNDVFFETRADLVPEDEGENVVLYDARVGGGFSHSSQACTGTGCQGVPPALPVFATPPSTTFDGVGNYPPGSTAPTVKRKRAATSGAQRLTKVLKVCRVKRLKRKRAICERQARKHFEGAKSKTSTASKERGN